MSNYLVWFYIREYCIMYTYTSKFSFCPVH